MNAENKGENKAQRPQKTQKAYPTGEFVVMA